jgi:hypothetical protein
MQPTKLLSIVSVLYVLLTAHAFAQTKFLFANGAGEVVLPAQYQRVTDSDAALAVVSRPEGNVRLFFDLHKLDAAVRVNSPGEALVREQAEKKKRKVSVLGNKTAFFDPGPDSVREGKTYANLHWKIGFEKTVIVMSASIPRDAREAADVDKFLSGEIETIVGSLKRAGP